MDAFYGTFDSAPVDWIHGDLKKKKKFQEVSFAFGQKEDTFTVCHTKLPSGGKGFSAKYNISHWGSSFWFKEALAIYLRATVYLSKALGLLNVNSLIMHWLSPSCAFEKDKICVCKWESECEEEKDKKWMCLFLPGASNLIKTTPKHTLSWNKKTDSPGSDLLAYLI